MKNTVLIDFDGVIRHWSSREIVEYSTALGLANNPLYACAFSEKLSMPAITGKITHDEWCDQVCAELAIEYGDSIALGLVDKWRSQRAEIDYEFLKKIRSLLPEGKLVLVTNATSRLNSDLASVCLEHAFDEVINSSDMGVAKPDPLLFLKLMKHLKVQANQCVFIDDTIRNVAAASSLGIESFLHTSTEETLVFIQKTCT